MQIQRTKNTVRNVLFGTIYRLFTTIMPFITRTIILYFLGADYLGLGGLFSSILSILSLTELGFSSAMVYSMYKPIAENDSKTICALLNLYKKFYRLIGFIILGLGLILVPFLSNLIKGEVPNDINLTLLYFIYLLNTVLSYFLFAYRGSLLTAHQRNDIDSKISIVISAVQYILQIAVLLVFRSYYAYAIMLPIATIATNIARLSFVKKLYPAYKAEGDISNEKKRDISKKVKALIGAKINTVVVNSADNIVMSAFLGLTVIATYNNYYFIMSAVVSFLGIIYSSMTAGLGNSLVIESRKKNFDDFNKFSFLNAWIVGWCSICLLCLYQPFIHIWTRGKLLFPFPIVVLLVIYFYIYCIRKISVLYKDAAGIWWEDRYRPYVCMIINVVSNIILVQIIGVAGIVISTILSFLISIPWENYTIFRYVFQCSVRSYYLKMSFYLVITLIAAVLTLGVCSLVAEGVCGLIIRGIICCIFPNIIWILLNLRNPELKRGFELIKRIVHLKKNN